MAVITEEMINQRIASMLSTAERARSNIEYALNQLKSKTSTDATVASYVDELENGLTNVNYAIKKINDTNKEWQANYDINNFAEWVDHVVNPMLDEAGEYLDKGMEGVQDIITKNTGRLIFLQYNSIVIGENFNSVLLLYVKDLSYFNRKNYPSQLVNLTYYTRRFHIISPPEINLSKAPLGVFALTSSIFDINTHYNKKYDLCQPLFAFLYLFFTTFITIFETKNDTFKYQPRITGKVK